MAALVLGVTEVVETWRLNCRVVAGAATAWTRQRQVDEADGLVRETVAAFGADWLSPEMLKSMCDDAERRRDRQPDPNSPFAKLLALKAQLEGKGAKD